MAPRSASTDAFAGGMLRWFDQHAAQGLFTTDRDLIIRTWNRWLVTATGLDADTVIGRPLADVLPSLIERSLDQHYRDALTGQVKILSHTLHRHLIPCPRTDGSLMPQSGRIAPLMDGDEVVGTITVIEDVSERVASEKMLRAQIAAADDARVTAETASRAKDEFLATRFARRSARCWGGCTC
jgi:PAS domain S-box-containing protein